MKVIKFIVALPLFFAAVLILSLPLAVIVDLKFVNDKGE